MTKLWSPLKAAIVVLAGASGNLHDKPFARGQALGTGIGTFAALAGALAYFVQSRRR